MDNISGQAVLNYLCKRQTTVDFSRDTLDVVLDDDASVVIRLVDKISGGVANFATGLGAQEFETTYGNEEIHAVINKGNHDIPVGVPVLMQYEYVIYQEIHKAWRLATIKPETPEYGSPYDQGPGVVWLKNVVAWMPIPKG